MFPARVPLATAIVKVLCRYDGVFWIVKFIPGFEHKTLTLDDELHLSHFAGKPSIPRMCVLTLMPFRSITGPSLGFPFELTFAIAQYRPLLSYLVGVQRQLELAFHEVWLSTILIAGDKGLRRRSENEKKKRQETYWIFHFIIPPMDPVLDLSANVMIASFQH